MAVHSACQPGRPGPHGDGQLGAVLPASAACQTAWSSGSRLAGSSMRPPLAASSASACSRVSPWAEATGPPENSTLPPET